MQCMAKHPINLRFDLHKLQWVDAYAKQRRMTRTAVLELAVEALMGDAAGGVPELEERAPARIAASESPDDGRSARVSAPRAPRPKDAEAELANYQIPKIARRYWGEGPIR